MVTLYTEKFLSFYLKKKRIRESVPSIYVSKASPLIARRVRLKNTDHRPNCTRVATSRTESNARRDGRCVRRITLYQRRFTLAECTVSIDRYRGCSDREETYFSIKLIKSRLDPRCK